jgi:AmmeMemoRadiSam system protein A
MRSPEAVRPEPRVSLRALARASIECGLRGEEPAEPDPADFPLELRRPGASFVTLRRWGELRGCTGSLEATRPLVSDVAYNARRAAFADPRFPPLATHELGELAISVSVLSPLEALPAASAAALLAALRPGVDGLVLREGARCATFLPAVWESLPEPADFLDALRQKAGLAPGHWSALLRFERYTTREAP